MSAIEYRNARFRVIISFVASFYILLHGHNLAVIIRAFLSPLFYVALIISFSITLLLVFLIHKVTIWLDARHDWRKHLTERIVWQFLFAVLLPVLVDLALISIYSAIIGQNFGQSRFLLVDFPIIVAFIILLNMYYVIRYLLLTDSVGTSDKKTSSLVIDYNGIRADIEPEIEVICFHRSVNLIKVVTLGRVYETRGDSINDFEKRFATRGFVRISRSTIVNLNFVQGFSPGSKRDTINVLYRSNVDVSHFNNDLFVVTEKYIQGFKDHFNSFSQNL